MPILSKINIPFCKNIENKIFLPKGRHRNGRITVLLGENGTRKSLILRNVIDDCFSQRERNQKIFPQLDSENSTEFHILPSQLIAISATPTDRFPAKSTPNERRTKYTWEDYYYLGPRTGRNLISRNHSVSELAYAILRNPSRLKEKSNFISRIMAKCELPTMMNFEIDVSPRFESYRSNANNKLAALDYLGYLNRFGQKHEMVSDKTVELLENFIHKIENDRKLSPRYGAPSDFRLLVDFKKGSAETVGANKEELLASLSTGLLKVRTLGFVDEILDIQSASSGQWNLFSSLVSLSLIVSDGALILIDEPENTLHPLWQSEYLHDVFDCISGKSGCEILVATHSPLLASSLKRGRDNTIRLSKSDGIITAELLESPEGWSANDILEDTFDLNSSRSSDIVHLIEKSLSLIANGINKNFDEIERLHVPLNRYQFILPQNDPLLRVISSILQATLTKAKKNKGQRENDCTRF